ncbi:thiamine pyrophosphate-binding protein [Methylobacterium mesophilicum]|nr:thiamine pyrophosphate-binding protein [Methylobacterium mesophilicum]
MNQDPASVSSRRSFLRAAAVGAGAAAATAVSQADAATQQNGLPATPEPKVPDAVASRASAPLPNIDFPMTGADVFARTCKAEGLAALFCCPGNYEVIHAIADQGIPAYSGRNEGAMASAADAFIRVTGEVAACSGTEGPGFTNMIGAIAAANSCRTPMLVLASNRDLRGEDSEQGIQMLYQQPLTEGIKKYGKRLILPSRVHEYAAYAFRQLRTGIPGPVHLDFPKEVAVARFRTARDIAYNVEKDRYRTESRPGPAAADIRKAVALIQQAQRPIIVSSTGVFYSRAWDALRAFAEQAQIPVVESGPVRGQFPDNHPLTASDAPSALPSADLVLLVGQYCMPTVGEYAFGPDAKYIRIEPEGGDIGRNLPIDLGIVSDERLALEALAEACPKLAHDPWLNEIATARKAFLAENDRYYGLGRGYTDAVHPAVIGKELADFLYRGDLPPDQTTVVSGGYGIARYTRRWLQANRAGQICNGAYQYGAIGPDVGYAVGVAAAVQSGIGPQAAHKGHPIVCITGDAGFGFTGMEVETLAKYRMPVVIIVYNNNSWGTWYPARNEANRAPLHLFQENLRYDRVAEGLGGHGEYVCTPEAFRPALERAWKVAETESRPTVINCQAKKDFWVKEAYEPGFLGKVEPGVMAYYH